MNREQQNSRAVNTIILVILIALLPLIFRFAPIPPLGRYFGAKIQLLEVAFVILFPVWIVLRLKRGDQDWRLPPGGLYFIGFVVVSLISALLSTEPTHALIDVAGFVYLLFLFFFFYHLLSDDRYVRHALVTFLVVSLVIVLIGLFGYGAYRLFGIENFAVEVYHGYLGIELVRPQSTFYTPNYYLIYMGLAATTALILLLIEERRWVKSLSIVVLILIAATTLSGFFRGSFVIWGVLFFGLGRFVQSRGMRALRGVILLVFLAFAALFFLQGYMNLSPVKVEHDTAAHRLGVSFSTQQSVYFNLHRTAIRIFLDHPLLGVGPGMYNAYMNSPDYGFDIQTYPWAKESGIDPHSTYLGYAAETGIMGVSFIILFFVGILTAFFRLSRSVDRPAREVGALLLIYLSLLLIYAVFIDIVSIRLLYFMYALGLSFFRGAAAPSWAGFLSRK